jgi:hypothetical protein
MPPIKKPRLTILENDCQYRKKKQNKFDSIDSEKLREMENFFDKFNQEIQEIRTLKAEIYEKSKHEIENLLNDEIAENTLNQVREQMLEEVNHRRQLMLVKASERVINPNDFKLLDFIQEPKILANKIRDQLNGNPSVEFFKNILKFRKFYKYTEANFHESFSTLIKNCRHFKELNLVPISYGKFLLGYKSNDGFYFYYLNDWFKGITISELKLASDKSLKVLVKNDKILFYEKDQISRVSLYDLKFQLIASKMIEAKDGVTKTFNLNENYIIIFFHDLSMSSIEFYNFSFEKIFVQDATPTLIGYQFLDANIEYLVFKKKNEIVLMNIHTRKCHSYFNSSKDNFIEAIIFKDSPCLLTFTTRYIILIKFDKPEDYKVEFKCPPDTFFLQRSRFKFKYQLSAYQDLLFFTNFPKDLFLGYINLSKF